jgi:hypothetical protein
VSEPKPLSPADFAVPHTPPVAPRARPRDVDDLAPEELAEIETRRERYAAMLAAGARIRDAMDRPDARAMQDATRAEWERRWRAKAVARAEAARVPLDEDVRRYALLAEPPPSQALDVVRQFLAWRAARSAALGGARAKALVVMLSPAGGGKTTAGAWALTWHRESALYVTAAEVSASPRTSYTDTHAPWKARITPDLLVLDEVGLERDPAPVVALMLERLAASRATIVTGNLTPAQFVARYADERLDTRLAQQLARGGPTLVTLDCGNLREQGE